MSMHTVISVENLGKKYQLSHQAQRQPYIALRDVITERAIAIGRKLRHPFHGSSASDQPYKEEFWALKDVSFQVKQGDRIGIIGRNGAGKSTLLKILSRITEPTAGQVKIKGRVASLLEVGTGFHPELTGRENIFLNGAILGMTRVEIKKKFDEIVDFAEIEKFLDTPVKRYSSGMYVRLAFAVAAHLEPEILLVDEVLAVGDAQFQKKCLGKMESVSRNEGRTVLFVSHNMSAVNRLCNRAIWLMHGKVKDNGQIDSIVWSYLTDSQNNGQKEWLNEHSSGNSSVLLRAVRVLDQDLQPVSLINAANPFHIQIEYEIVKVVNGLRIGFFLCNSEGVVIFAPNDIEGGIQLLERKVGKFTSTCMIPGKLLNEGSYSITVSSDIPGIGTLFFEPNVIAFNIERISGGYSMRPDRLPGVIVPDLDWKIHMLDRG